MSLASEGAWVRGWGARVAPSPVLPPDFEAGLGKVTPWALASPATERHQHRLRRVAGKERSGGRGGDRKGPRRQETSDWG